MTRNLYPGADLLPVVVVLIGEHIEARDTEVIGESPRHDSLGAVAL